MTENVQDEELQPAYPIPTAHYNSQMRTHIEESSYQLLVVSEGLVRAQLFKIIFLLKLRPK